ncbi:MAG: isocitrate lyase/phosphoenolpyruvate mutase family protein [Alphaproteobacteria bacterium]|nr:isocitrate lyase/phosphoenolpyruvate mutase family protein [Alphaproteobacteria bacterium]
MSETSLESKAKQFHSLHTAPEILILPNAWDVASALILAESGFPAIASTSAGVAFSRGFRDGEQISREEMIAEAGKMAARLDIPVTGDLESGYGIAPEEMAETVRQAIDAGLVGCNIEDGTKDGDAPLFDFALSVERIQAAREAADSAGIEFVINARTDGFLRMGAGSATLDDAIARANAYYEAGARSLFVPGVSDGQTIGRLARDIAGPVNILAGPKTPPAPELQSLGVARVSVGGGIARAAYTTTQRAAEELRKSGGYGFTENTYSNAELNALLDAET